MRRLLVPYLIGQRRDGLARVCDLDNAPWAVLDDPAFTEARLVHRHEQMSRMGCIYARLADLVRETVEGGDVPLSIAGDCLSALGVLAGLQQADRSPDRILWLDAHGDFHTWATTQTQYLGGMPLAMMVGRNDGDTDDCAAVTAMRTAIGVQPYPERQIILSDARDLDPGEREALHGSEILCCGISEILENLPPEQTLYLHLDTDVMDAEAELPALKYHVKSGPSYGEIAGLFRGLRRHRIVAVSVSGWHEEQDKDNRTAQACLALLELLSEAG